MIELAVENKVPGACIKVIGVGGAGGNTLNSIIASGYKGVEYIAVNTDAQALEHSKADVKIQLGLKSTKGLGTGANPDLGKRAAEEDIDKVMEAVEGADIVFLTGGMGGGTGSGALPVIARTLKEKGILCIAVVTKPFIFEGKRRGQIANQIIDQLEKDVDILIVIPNQKLLEIVDTNVSMIEAFDMINLVLGQSVKSISDIIANPGHINVDFADVRTIMKDRGLALMGTARAAGKDRAMQATMNAISSPLLENMNIQGARAVLLNITGGANLSLHEISQAASIIYEMADADAQIILGSVIDQRLSDEVVITIIATGFEKQMIKEIQTARIEVEPIKEVVVAQAVVETKQEEVEQLDQAAQELEQALALIDQDDLDVPAYLRKQAREKSENF